MLETSTPELAFGGLALAAAVFLAAWYEYARSNRRDAGLLAASGAVTLIGSTVALYG